MSDCISKRKLLRHISEEYHEYGEDYDALQILGDVEDFPTEDAVKVVRCKDCKYYTPIKRTNRCWCVIDSGLPTPNTNDYCSYGEK